MYNTPLSIKLELGGEDLATYRFTGNAVQLDEDLSSFFDDLSTKLVGNIHINSTSYLKTFQLGENREERKVFCKIE